MNDLKRMINGCSLYVLRSVRFSSYQTCVGPSDSRIPDCPSFPCTAFGDRWQTIPTKRGKILNCIVGPGNTGFSVELFSESALILIRMSVFRKYAEKRRELAPFNALHSSSALRNGRLLRDFTSYVMSKTNDWESPALRAQYAPYKAHLIHKRIAAEYLTQHLNNSVGGYACNVDYVCTTMVCS